MSDPVATAQAVMARAEALLVEVRQARIALAAAAESPALLAGVVLREAMVPPG
jgi:hypothetical protein